MRADITQRCGAKQRIANGVRQRVAVRMADRAFIERDSHPAQYQLSARGEAVNVVADANSKEVLYPEF